MVLWTEIHAGCSAGSSPLIRFAIWSDYSSSGHLRVLERGLKSGQCSTWDGEFNLPLGRLLPSGAKTSSLPIRSFIAFVFHCAVSSREKGLSVKVLIRSAERQLVVQKLAIVQPEKLVPEPDLSVPHARALPARVSRLGRLTRADWLTPRISWSVDHGPSRRHVPPFPYREGCCTRSALHHCMLPGISIHLTGRRGSRLSNGRRTPSRRTLHPCRNEDPGSSFCRHLGTRKPLRPWFLQLFPPASRPPWKSCYIQTVYVMVPLILIASSHQIVLCE